MVKNYINFHFYINFCVVRLIIFLSLILSSLLCCKSPAENPVITRDTTITPQTAITTMKLDSSEIVAFNNKFNLPESTSRRIMDFYISRNFQYCWFNEDGLAEQAKVFWNMQNYYMQTNRDSTLYEPQLSERMKKLIADSTLKLKPEFRLATELSLTLHFFEYAQFAFAGKINPSDLQWHIPRKKIDPVALLDSLVKHNGKNSEEWLPVNKTYLDLANSLSKYYDIEKNGGWDTLPLNLSVKLNDRTPQISLLKNRLAFEDTAYKFTEPELFDSALAAHIDIAKDRYGLIQNGKVAKDLITELNISASERIKQMLVNLERMRWLPEIKSNIIIVANIPDFTLRVFENNNVVLKMNIVVGKEGTSSVIFTDNLKYVVFAPYWNVPESIVRNEIVPGMSRQKNYIANHNMEITGYRNGLPVVRQKPGGSNSLGLVKFIFPNNYNIYLHDTPAKSLFNSSNRAFSHGCIRIQKPKELAEFLLRDQPKWTDSAIVAAMNSGKEKWVSLIHPVPVMITYFTCYVSNNGTVHFSKDVYGYDKKLSERLFSN